MPGAIFIDTIGSMADGRARTAEAYPGSLAAPGILSAPYDIAAPPWEVLLIGENSQKHASGVRTSMDYAIKELQLLDHLVTVVCPEPTQQTWHGVEVHGIASNEMWGFPVARPKRGELDDMFSRYEARADKNERAKVVHLAAPMGISIPTPGSQKYCVGYEAARIADARGLPTVAVYQTDIPAYARRMKLSMFVPLVNDSLRRIHGHADINLVPSTTAWKSLVDIGVDEDSIRLWGRGVDTELFNPRRRTEQTPGVAEARATYAPNGERIILSVSRLAPEKELHRLEALIGIPNTRLVLVGAGTEEEKLRKRFGNGAIFTGKLTGEALADMFAASDIFVHTGPVETFGQTLQEAMASGLPVVAVKRGGPIDIVKKASNNGFLYEPVSKGLDLELRHYVTRLAEDQELRDLMGLDARRSVEDRTWPILIKELEGHYGEAMILRQERMAQPIGRLALAS